MVSSTFNDLVQHRAALVKAIKAHGLTDIAMENDSAKLSDVIDSSLQMVSDSSAYIGIISMRYGQIPECAKRNPDKLSITELEFNEATRLGRPILLFLMGENHLLRKGDFELSAVNGEKLDAFRARAKVSADSRVHRVYATFDSLEEFQQKIGPSIAELRRFLDAQPEATGAFTSVGRKSADPAVIPKPPALYAEPAYIGSHQFIGRQATLSALSDWASPANPHAILLFDAIGGNGKSMLTWEWTTRHATKASPDWAGRIWYSFYERGAIMADFCQHALAYITGQPLERFQSEKTPKLMGQLVRHLQARPWLLILDGLERILVAYHRIDAAIIPDEDANTPTDEIAERDPCAAIRPEDDDSLRALAAVAPSKVIITSRLMPRVLLNQAGQAIPGVQRIALPGLRPADAEALLRSCGVTGDSESIRRYLATNCDCHPLVIGVLAGLINDYLPDKGNFDCWANDPTGGGQLNLANLDLIQRRNHILKAAMDALSESSRRLLSTLALLSESVDYRTLSALNPHLPPEPLKVHKPVDPKTSPDWQKLSGKKKAHAQREFETERAARLAYDRAVEERPQSVLKAGQELAKTLRDLERRGLLQYDAHIKRYDLHPVVRGVAAGGIRSDERNQYGKRVIDYFSRQAHDPYEQAQTLDDLRDGLHIIRTMLKVGQLKRAYDFYKYKLSSALFFNLEAYAEVLALLRPFFPNGWGTLPIGLGESSGSFLANDAGIALDWTDEPRLALDAFGATILADAKIGHWEGVALRLRNISNNLSGQNRLSQAERILLLTRELAGVASNRDLFLYRLWHFSILARLGRNEEAEGVWLALDPMGRHWSREYYRPGMAELEYARFQFRKGVLVEKHVATAEQLAREGMNRATVRECHGLRGTWLIERGQWALAAESLSEAVRMAREANAVDGMAETQIVLARFNLGQLTDTRREARTLAGARRPAHQALAELWLAIGDHEQAKKHALASYKWAWADGEPYVNRYELNKAKALLEQLGTDIPNLPRYNSAKDEKFSWEGEVELTFKRLRH
jgi:hypothetical protein